MEIKYELEVLLNKHCKDNDCNTPDFILAEYLIDCLRNFQDTQEKLLRYHKQNKVQTTIS